MGHFGRRPIQMGWFFVALPGLFLNYFGQGALLLQDPGAAENPFYRLAPSWGLLPLVGLATLATIIASQAVISGAFSLTRQAVQLGYLPRISIVHTSSDEIGQIYVPTMNRVLFLSTVGLVIGFGSSSNLAAAYGVAVTTTMVMTTLVMNVVVRKMWGWSWPASILFSAPFLLINLSFFSAALVKVPQGGWFPLVVGVVIFAVMTTWRRGRQILAERLRDQMLPTDMLVESLKISPPLRVPGTAVFMSGNPQGTPPVLLHNLKYNKILHEKVILLTIVTEEVSHVPAKERVEVREIMEGMYRVLAHYGFMESPDVPDVLRLCGEKGLEIDIRHTAFFLSRERLIITRNPGMAIWRERLFAFMSRNALGATAFFNIPPNQVVELGIQVQL
jgi:KUP system potassium uptake protein